MIYLLDTDLLIFMIRGLKANGRRAKQRQQAGVVVDRCRAAHAAGDSVGLSAITVSELEFGAQNSGKYDEEIAAVQQVLTPFEVYDYDAVLGPRHYGRIRHDLEASGQSIGSMDVLIAAHAMALDAVMVTNNEAHFRRIPGLKVVNWAKA